MTKCCNNQSGESNEKEVERYKRLYASAQSLLNDEQQALDRYALGSFAGVIGAVVAFSSLDSYRGSVSTPVTFLFFLSITNYFAQIILTMISHILSRWNARQQREKLHLMVSNARKAKKGGEGKSAGELKYKKTTRESMTRWESRLEAINAINPFVFIFATILLWLSLLIFGVSDIFHFNFDLSSILLVYLFLSVLLVEVLVMWLYARHCDRVGLPLDTREHFQDIWPDGDVSEGNGEQQRRKSHGK